MPRFVCLEHDHPSRHWDLLLEAGPVLLSWRLASPPALGQAIAAERVADHRLFYLDHEGPVSGGRGSVSRWDSGEFEWVENAPDRVVARLQGDRLDGTMWLEQQSEADWIGTLVG